MATIVVAKTSPSFQVATARINWAASRSILANNSHVIDIKKYCDGVRSACLGAGRVDGKSDDLLEAKRTTSTDREHEDQMGERVAR